MSITETKPATASPASIVALLEKQHAMLGELVSLAASQAAFINQGDADQLLNLLAKRQAIIDEFTNSQSELASYTQALDEKLENLDGPERERIKTLVNEIGDRLAQVMRRDEEDQALLRRSRDHIKNELSGLDSARKARSAYRPQHERTDRFADRHG